MSEKRGMEDSEIEQLVERQNKEQLFKLFFKGETISP